jgi:hypothetical protein
LSTLIVTTLDDLVAQVGLLYLSSYLTFSSKICPC